MGGRHSWRNKREERRGGVGSLRQSVIENPRKRPGRCTNEKERFRERKGYEKHAATELKPRAPGCQREAHPRKGGYECTPYKPIIVAETKKGRLNRDGKRVGEKNDAGGRSVGKTD